jgi:hypothetical protein
MVERDEADESPNAALMKQVAAALEAFERPFAASIEARARAIAPADLKLSQADRDELITYPMNPSKKPRPRSWYAVQIIDDIQLVRDAIAAGDAHLAAARALQIGVMAREAELLPWARRALALRQAQQGAARTTAEPRRQQHALWRQEAAKLWTEHPLWSALRVAKVIDPKRQNTVRRKIGDLDPKRQKKNPQRKKLANS